MIVRSSEFEISAVRPSQWPSDGLPEFAFVGRSNVGKSSLLNRLLGRKSLARVSATPGKTQQINFFRVNDQFRLVDLPGYGYAAVSKSSRAAFAKLIEGYLRQRDPLLRVLHLIDIRHDPSAHDVEMHTWLQSLGLPLCVVATKLDKVSKSAVKPSTQNIRSKLRAQCEVMPVSSEKNQGMDDLWSILESDLTSLQQESLDAVSDVMTGREQAPPHT